MSDYRRALPVGSLFNERGKVKKRKNTMGGEKVVVGLEIELTAE
ncbi:hypothetical protein [Paenibacillus eucommiae]|uniref:Uncharacterized protein n=1 Tax=Paenibacillus eucommiae TaxID=1355755 RepID=A0ABS4J8Q1_9BACL|nr:hypothetical protein [Paenibacillus eucommiae]MBP1996214.1 hypothetical protein [Paenibacillus eucommiae]